MARAVPEFKKGEVEEGVYVDDLTDIVYDYAQLTLQDILESLVAYGENPKVYATITGTNGGLGAGMWITYEESTCQKCGGGRGCFNLHRSGGIVCSIKEVLTAIAERFDYIDVIEVDTGNDVVRLYNIGSNLFVPR